MALQTASTRATLETPNTQRRYFVRSESSFECFYIVVMSNCFFLSIGSDTFIKRGGRSEGSSEVADIGGDSLLEGRITDCQLQRGLRATEGGHIETAFVWTYLVEVERGRSFSCWLPQERRFYCCCGFYCLRLMMRGQREKSIGQFANLQ